MKQFYGMSQRGSGIWKRKQYDRRAEYGSGNSMAVERNKEAETI